MKIINPGVKPEPPKPWWVGIKVKCPTCFCQMELEEGDKVSTSQARHPDAVPKGFTSCPSCNSNFGFYGDRKPLERGPHGRGCQCRPCERGM